MTKRFELGVKDRHGTEQHYRLSASGLIVGRSPDVDVVISEAVASRRHVHIWVEEETVLAEDLGSRNGILVNGKAVSKAKLGPGDELKVGEHTFSIIEYETPSTAQTIISYDSGSTLCNSLVGEGTGRFRVLYKAAQLLGTVFDLDELLKQILEVVFDALDVQRGFVLTVEDDAGRTEVRASLSSDPADADAPLSHTLIDHVIANGEAILTVDAAEDDRFASSQSIVGHRIRAAMCAPLCGRQSVIGAVYVDSGRTGSQYEESDLELLTVIGRVVGVAVENARLYRENLERERLAMLGQALAGLGHCVKNILTAIKGGGEFVDRALAESDLKHLERGWPIMRRAISRIEMLMMNMLTLARDRQPNCAPTDVNDIVREVLFMEGPRAEKNNIEMQFEPGELGVALVDGREVFRVVLNLITNALDACEDQGGTITVSTTTAPRGTNIIVKDDGPGIPPEILERIPEAFVTSKGSGGTGLGLACSFKIVRAHGGDITIDSEPGQGATFTVYLPDDTSIGRKA